jgi:hypothetical protein
LNIEQIADGLQASSHRNGGVFVMSGLLALQLLGGILRLLATNLGAKLY